MNEAASDSESSDSETCPKLSQGMSRKKNVQRSSSLMNHRNAILSSNPYSSRPLSVAKSVMDPVKKGLCNVWNSKSYVLKRGYFQLNVRLRSLLDHLPIQAITTSSRNKHAFKSKPEWRWPKPKTWLISRLR